MNINVQIPDKSFDFNKISLGEPISIGNQVFFSKILNDNDLYIQTPEIKCKDGIISNNKKPYIDLLIEREHEDILEWIEALEQRLQVLIYNNKNEWFQDSNIDISDIENIFISPIKNYKKQYSLRVYLDNPTSLINKKDIKIYNENNNPLSKSDIDSKSNIIVLLHINGLKFSSKNFQIHIEIKEIMKIFNENQCNYIIKQIQKTKKSNELEKNDSLEENKNEAHEIKKSNLNESYEENAQQKTKENIKEEVKEDIKEEVKEDIKEEVKEDIKEEVKEDIKEEIKQQTEEKDDENNINKLYECSEDDINNIKDGITEYISKELNKQESLNKQEYLDKEEPINDIKEFNVLLDEIDEKDKIHINYPSDDDREIYKQALLEAKEARKKALDAYLHAKNIKAQYLLNLESESDSDDSESGINI
jgi:hypothetical protein